MIPTKYPKRTDYAMDDKFSMRGWVGKEFKNGSAYMHCRYLFEMRAKHPIIYILWFRWWIPTLLHEEERAKFAHDFNYCKHIEFRPFWADFAMHHPIQYLLYFLFCFTFQVIVKALTTPIKMVSWIFKPPVASDSEYDVLFDEKLVEQKSNMPTDNAGRER